MTSIPPWLTGAVLLFCGLTIIWDDDRQGLSLVTGIVVGVLGIAIAMFGKRL